MAIAAQPIPRFQLATNALFRAREPHLGTPGTLTGAVVSQYNEFYCDPVNGSNINGGSDSGASPSYSATNGNWNGTTTYTPTDGSNPYGTVRVGQYASVFIDAATVAVYVAMVTGVQNAVNGTITLSSTKNAGSAPTSSATARSIRVGGAWKGPNAAVTWPFTAAWAAALGFNNEPPRINYKNNSLYSITAFMNASGTGAIHRGYTDYPGDGGKANIDGGTTAAVLHNTGLATYWDLIWSNNGTTGTNNLVSVASGVFIDCIFHDCRGPAISGSATFLGCEFYNWNTSNAAGFGAITISVSVWYVENCYFHDAPVTNGNAIVLSGAGNPSFKISYCIFDNIGGNAISYSSGANHVYALVNNCSFFKVAKAAITDGSTSQAGSLIASNNIIVATGWFYDGTIQAFPSANRRTVLLYNNVYGQGSYAVANPNRSITGPISEFNPIVLPADVSPWVAELTGDFTLIRSALFNTGRSKFTQTGSSKTGTASYPDPGATMHLDIAIQNLNLSTTTFPDGYISHAYSIIQTFTGTATITLQSGALPPGLSLTQTTTIWSISGTPTTLGTYDFTLRLTSGSVFFDYLCHITIKADPDEGVGGVGGG